MAPRERVLAALDHQRPDRTPRSSLGEECTWKRVFTHVGHEDKDRLLDDLGVHQNFWGERYIHRQTLWGPKREGVRALAEAKAVFAPHPASLPSVHSHNSTCASLPLLLQPRQ